MANKFNQLTIPQLKTAIAAYVASNKIAQSYQPTFNNTANLVDKIGKMFTIDQVQSDKLTKFDGDFLPYGSTVEEWAIDLGLPYAYDDLSYTDALKDFGPTYRPNTYSEKLGHKVFAITKYYNDLQKAVNNESQLSELTYAITRNITNQVIAWRYAMKREMIGKYADKVIGLTSGSTVTDRTNAGAIVDGTYYRKGTSAYGVAVKTAPSNMTYDNAVAGGYIVTLKMLSALAKPVDTATGEAFVKQIKADAEKATDISEGYSLHGNTLGATEGLTLVMLQGIMPSIDVDTMAGAFNQEKLSIPADIITVPDFGTENNGVYAVLMDNRAIRLFTNFESTLSEENGAKAWGTIFRHLDCTAHFSYNCFVKVYKNVEA